MSCSATKMETRRLREVTHLCSFAFASLLLFCLLASSISPLLIKAFSFCSCFVVGFFCLFILVRVLSVFFVFCLVFFFLILTHMFSHFSSFSLLPTGSCVWGEMSRWVAVWCLVAYRGLTTTRFIIKYFSLHSIQPAGTRKCLWPVNHAVAGPRQLCKRTWTGYGSDLLLCRVPRQSRRFPNGICKTEEEADPGLQPFCRVRLRKAPCAQFQAQSSWVFLPGAEEGCEEHYTAGSSVGDFSNYVSSVPVCSIFPSNSSSQHPSILLLHNENVTYFLFKRESFSTLGSYGKVEDVRLKKNKVNQDQPLIS